MATVDIKEAKKYLLENTSRIEELLEYFGFHGFNYTTDSLRCAVPDGNNTSSVAIYLSENLNGMVYTRGSYKGDIFGIIEYITERELSEIFSITRSLFGLSKSGFRGGRRQIGILGDLKKYRKGKVIDVKNKLYDNSVLKDFVLLPHSEILEEGISPAVSIQFNLCYDPRGDRIIFPHYDWYFTDKIVGLKARKVALTTDEANLLGIAKYTNYIKGYKKTENLYGWNNACQNIANEKRMILFEGEKSVLKEFTLKQGAGISVALGGHIISDSQIKIIARHTPIDTEVILAFDRDVLDNKEEFERVMEQVKKLAMFRKISLIKDEFPVGKLLGEKDCPIDKGIKIWRYLYESRKRIK